MVDEAHCISEVGEQEKEVVVFTAAIIQQPGANKEPNSSEETRVTRALYCSDHTALLALVSPPINPNTNLGASKTKMSFRGVV